MTAFRPVRLHYLAASTLPSGKANAVHVMRMAQGFSRAGAEVMLVAADGGGEEGQALYDHYGVQRSFEIRRCRRPGLRQFGSLLYGWRAARLSASAPADLLYGRCPHSLLFATRRGAPFAYEAHDLPNRPQRRWLERTLFARPGFRRLVVISAALKRDYLASFSMLRQDDVLVCHDGADLPSEAPDTDYFRGRDAQAGLDVGYVGSLFPGKGAEQVLELARARPAHRFHIVGGSEEERARLSPNAPDNVTFHGRVAPSRVQKTMRAFDVLLLPAQRRVETARGGDIAAYTSPLKMFEYMAAGRPMIASSLPVLEEVLDNDVNALLADPESTAEWGRALDRFSGQPALRERIARRAFADLEAEYTWPRRAQRILAALDVSPGTSTVS